MNRSMVDREKCLRLLNLVQRESGGRDAVPMDNDEMSLCKQLGETERRLIRLIESEQESILKECNQLRKSKESISKYKSAWMNSSGEEIDEQL